MEMARFAELSRCIRTGIVERMRHLRKQGIPHHGQRRHRTGRIRDDARMIAHSEKKRAVIE